MYFLLAITLIFALLLLVNLAASLTASVVWHLISRSARRFAPGTRSQIIFLLRILPVAIAAIVVFAFLLPAYLLYEPDKSGEIVSLKLALIALVSAAGIVTALYRVFRTWRVTSQLAADWMRNAEPLVIDGVDIPVYSIEHPFPLIAVVGMLKPRMFVARQIFGLLEPAEFEAAIAHERGHLTTRDNLKRTALRVCRDLVVLPFGRRLDRDWAANAESGADDFAAGVGGDVMAVNLAAALMKIARTVPARAYPAMSSASFLIEDTAGPITSRVKRLLDRGQSSVRKNNGLPFGWASLLLAVATIFVLAGNENVLRGVHDAMEHFVDLLQ
jgi:Zn-dependent protease with chaperone function